MRITEYTLTHPKAPDLTLALVADLHCRRGDTALTMLQALAPDLILSSGDMMESCQHARPDDAQNLPGFTFMRQAAQLAPLYYSIGNHEGGMQPGNEELLAQNGITLLDNRFVETHGILIGGLSSTVLCGYRRPKIPPLPDTDFLSRFAAAEGFHVLLNHHPEFWPELVVGTGVELTLSGHAHGGQWRLLGQDIWSPGQGLFPRYASGKHTAKGGETLVVSRGMANTVSVPRFGNPPELVVIRLKKGQV